MSIVGPRNALADLAMEMVPLGGAVPMPQAQVPDPMMGGGQGAPMWMNNPQIMREILAQYLAPGYQNPVPIGARPAPYQMQYVPAERSAFGGGYMWDPRGQTAQAFGAAPPPMAPQRPAPRPSARPVSREMSADQLNALVLGALGGQAPAAQGTASYGADQNIRRFMGV